MAFTFNGIGTSFCFARGFGGGGDALECFVIAFMPIIPLRAVHLHDETAKLLGSQYQVVPLTGSGALALRVYLRYWLLIPLVLGVANAIFSTWQWWKHGDMNVRWLTVGWALTALCLLIYFTLWRSDRRNRLIRGIMGRHEFGTSDPAMWDRSVLSHVRSPQEIFGTDTFIAAVPVLVEKRDYPNAMRAARLAVALEEREAAERLTDHVVKMHQTREPVSAR